MVKMLRFPAVVSAALFMSALCAAQAQDLNAQRARSAEERALNREVSYTNEVCDARIQAGIDWRSAQGWPADRSLAEACDLALGAVEAVCRSGGASRVSEGVKRFQCAGDGAGPQLADGRLRFGAGGAHTFQSVRRYLDGALR